jgi:hypothetical protein
MRIVAKDLVLPSVVAAVGALGALPGARSGADPVALLAWLALWSAPAGFLCGAAAIAIGPLALLPPGAWTGLYAIVDGLSPRDLPSPAWAALAWTGLYAAGFGLGRMSPRARFSGAGALFLLSGLLCALPIAPGLLGGPLPPPVSARLLDLSPLSLLAECAGLDWMRHRAVYDTAGTANIDPSLRIAYRGMLAGPIVFVVGCVLAAAGEGIARVRSKAARPERWPSTSTSAPSRRI